MTHSFYITYHWHELWQTPKSALNVMASGCISCWTMSSKISNAFTHRSPCLHEAISAEYVTTLGTWAWHDSFTCVTWLIRMCDRTHLYAWYNAFWCVTWLIRMCICAQEADCTENVTTLGTCVWHDSFTCVTWLIRTCDRTHLYAWYNAFWCVTWLIRMCICAHEAVSVKHVTMVGTCVWHESFACVTWLIRMCDMTHPCVWHASLLRVTWLIHMCDMTHSSVWHDSFICVHVYTRLSVPITSPRWAPVCDMAYGQVWHDSFVRVTWVIRTCDMTHS